MVTEILLSKQGYKHKGKYVAIIDDCDADLLNFRWNVSIADNSRKYAIRKEYIDSRKYKVIPIHRTVLERIIGRSLESHEDVDHIDGDGLRNTRDNLRLATRSQNQSNRGMQRNNTAGYKGVTLIKNGKYQAQIKFQKKSYYLGCFDNPEDAYKAYCEKAKELHGEFSRLK